MIPVSELHHIEVPCSDLEQAEEFYSRVFGARVYYRKSGCGQRLPLTSSIAELRASGIEVGGTFLEFGANIRIGFLARCASHQQREIDHLALSVGVESLDQLKELIRRAGLEVSGETEYYLLVRDCFGMQLELYPAPLLAEVVRKLRTPI